jgi:hypothetical protein
MVSATNNNLIADIESVLFEGILIVVLKNTLAGIAAGSQAIKQANNHNTNRNYNRNKHSTRRWRL